MGVSVVVAAHAFFDRIQVAFPTFTINIALAFFLVIRLLAPVSSDVAVTLEDIVRFKGLPLKFKLQGPVMCLMTAANVVQVRLAFGRSRVFPSRYLQFGLLRPSSVLPPTSQFGLLDTEGGQVTALSMLMGNLTIWPIILLCISEAVVFVWRRRNRRNRSERSSTTASLPRDDVLPSMM